LGGVSGIGICQRWNVSGGWNIFRLARGHEKMEGRWVFNRMGGHLGRVRKEYLFCK
jgi:hypothetical protein